MKITNNQAIGINQALQSLNIDEINQKTAYWASRNLRIISNIIFELDKLQSDIRKDKWFQDFQKDIESLGTEKAEEKWKENLDAANDELKIFGDKETEIDFYQISIDKLDIPSKIVPILMDLISE